MPILQIDYETKESDSVVNAIHLKTFIGDREIVEGVISNQDFLTLEKEGYTKHILVGHLAKFILKYLSHDVEEKVILIDTKEDPPDSLKFNSLYVFFDFYKKRITLGKIYCDIKGSFETKDIPSLVVHKFRSFCIDFLTKTK